VTWPIFCVLLIGVAVVDLIGIVMWYACAFPRSQLLGPALVCGKGVGRRIALTFDDGPLPPYTEQILDVLRDLKIRATFFVCGEDAERYPQIVRRMHAEGHTIGNHTYSHPYLHGLGRTRMAQEIDRTQETIKRLTGQSPRLFRPPYGARWFGLYALLGERGMHLVQWSNGGYDWKMSAEAIVQTTISKLRPGSVILLHDGVQAPGGFLGVALRRIAHKGRDQRAVTQRADRSATVLALPAIIEGAHKAGFEFVSVEDLLPDL
jgi:peptidoglycan/xylan/chitin deacetylase (PgdA/CDA1 family)